MLGLQACEDRDAWRMTEEEVIELSTRFGTMHIWLYKETPLHRENFLKLAYWGYYDTTEFHRVMRDFLIYGGDPLSADSIRENDGTGSPPWDIDAEIDSSRFQHVRGALGAWRLDDAVNPERNSHGSQFYIVTNHAGAHFLDGRFTVFGRVLSGMEVADSINRLDLLVEQPIERVKMQVKVVLMKRYQLEQRYGFRVED